MFQGGKAIELEERSGVKFGELSLGPIESEMPPSHHTVPLSHQLDMRHAFAWCLSDLHSFYGFYGNIISFPFGGFNLEVSLLWYTVSSPGVNCLFLFLLGCLS